MNGDAVLGALAGAGMAGGVVVLVHGLRGAAVDDMAGRRSWRGWPWRRLAAAAASGLVVLVVTQWVAVAAAVAAVVGYWRQMFGGGRAARSAIDRLEALAAWTESLRDMVATGVGLPEALAASLPAASPVLVPALSGLVERLHARDPLETALRRFAADLDDVSADLVVAALVLNSRAQGRALHAVLSALASSTRSELAMRRSVEADRRATRRGVQIVLVVTVAMALGLQLLNPAYVAPYHSATGQLVLAVIVAVFAGGFLWPGWPAFLFDPLYNCLAAPFAAAAAAWLRTR